MDQQFDLVTDSEALFRFLLVSRVRTVVGAGGGVTETVRATMPTEFLWAYLRISEFFCLRMLSIN